MKFCHPGYQIVLEYDIYGRTETKVQEGGVLSLKPETREKTVAQARIIQCLKCNQVYTLNPQLNPHRGS